MVLVVVLDARIGEIKEEGEGKLGGRHAGQGHGHSLGEAKTEDSVDALKVWGVAGGDASKLCEGEVVAQLHDVVCLVALEGRVVSVLEEELTVLDVTQSLRGAGVKPGRKFIGIYRVRESDFAPPAPIPTIGVSQIA